LMIPPDPANPALGMRINSIKDYGRTTLEQVQQWEATFINAESRNSQNSKLLYDLLMNSLSNKGIQRVQIWHDQYRVDGRDSGGSLFKIITRESYLDSNATVSTIRLNLTNLDEYILNNGSDVVAFNAYVQGQVDGLTARGHTTADLVVNLFKGYKAISDTNFADYLKTIENSHEDGSAIVSASSLMLKAVNFYKTKLTRDQWERPTKHQKDVLVLQAQVFDLEKKARKVTFDKKDVERKAKATTKDNTKSSVKPERPSWLTSNIKPKDDSMGKYRTWNNAKWYWCDTATGGKCGGKWRTHNPKECKGLAPAKPSSKNKGTKRKSVTLKLAAANAALATEQEDSDYEE
jgi:hypothetical protein